MLTAEFYVGGMSHASTGGQSVMSLIFVFFLCITSAFAIWALSNESCFNELIVSALEDQFREVSLFSKGEMLFLISHSQWRGVSRPPQYFMVETLDVH